MYPGQHQQHLNLLGRRVTVAESVTIVNGKLEWGTPKSHARRSVGLPPFLADLLGAHVAGKVATPRPMGVTELIKSFRQADDEGEL